MIPYTPIIQHITTEKNAQLDVLRLDLLHPEVSGNKWFKLKKNLEHVLSQNYDTVVTFGGAFSNHIAATAAACRQLQLRSVGIIRGEENVANPTLQEAKNNGMDLHFVSRVFYKQKNDEIFQAYIHEKFGRCYVIPEGGNNTEGLLGCKEILQAGWDHDFILCACGTGTTFAGLVASKKQHQTIIGISVLKGKNELPLTVETLLKTGGSAIHKISGNEVLDKENIDSDCIINAYAFSGYAKPDPHLLAFKHTFESQNKFELDHVYTTKLMYAVHDLVQQNKIPANSKILAVHSGGLQGNKGFEERYHLIPKR